MTIRGWSLAVVCASLLAAGCDNANQKLSALAGTTFVGDAPPARVMGVLMYGRYKISFSKNENGQIKCFMTTTIHDGERGWGQPEVEEMKDLIFEDGVDNAVLLHRNPEISCSGVLKSGQIPDTMTTFNERYDIITLQRIKN